MQFIGDDVCQRFFESEHRQIAPDATGARHHPTTNAILLQKLVEMTFLVVLAFADVQRNVHVSVGLSGVAGKTFPAEVILQRDATQCSRYRFGRVAKATCSNALRVPERQQ